MYGRTNCNPICGDGRTIEPEDCDDGIKDDNIGCNSNCFGSLPGYYCPKMNLNGTKICYQVVCGDGKIMGNERCDDGNKTDNKGCKSDCSDPLNGWYCVGGDLKNPSECSTRCGDGKFVPETE